MKRGRMEVLESEDRLPTGCWTKTLNWAATFKQRQGGKRAGVGLENVSWCKEPKAKGRATVKSQRTGGAI